MEGKIVKGIAGFYYVEVVGSGIYECKARGIFRKEEVKPLVGDEVSIDVTDEKAREGTVVAVKERRNELIRPAVANVDQALVVFAAARPEPNFYLLDGLLAELRFRGVPAVICFNKADLTDAAGRRKISDIYANSGYKLIFTSARFGNKISEKRGTRYGAETVGNADYGRAGEKFLLGMKELTDILRGQVTVVMGPSGVGKSTIANLICPGAAMETGGVSEKAGRGRHTTRRSELLPIREGRDMTGYIMDTPGFSAFSVTDISAEELKNYFPETARYNGQCRFSGCSHTIEPGCKVREAVSRGEMDMLRYEHYVVMYQTLKNRQHKY